MAYEPRWGKSIGKHRVPLTLFDEVAPEPRGASDRRRALDQQAPALDRLARGLGEDRELEAAAATVLASRAGLMAELGGQGDLVARTADDARVFAAPAGVGASPANSTRAVGGVAGAGGAGGANGANRSGSR
jgi:hypothetical protein